MKVIRYILVVCLLAGFAGCKQKEKDKPASGEQQVAPPVENSGAETERDRALESVKQDTSNTEITVGKDAAGVKTKKGTSASIDSSGVKYKDKKVKVNIKRDTSQ